jgi:hypothetical protein
MYYAVTHGSHVVPGDFWVSLLHFIGNIIGSFTNDDEIELYSSNRAGIILKVGEIYAVSEILNFRDRVQDITDTLFPFPR